MTREEFETCTEEEFDTSVGAELGIPRPRNGTATQMIRWWADIGIRFIESRYSSDSGGPGARPRPFPCGTILGRWIPRR